MLLLIVFVACGLVYGLYRLFKISNRRAVIAAVKNGQGVLTTWSYSHSEWPSAAENQFGMRPKTGDAGKVFFTPRYICVSSGRKDILWELVGDQKYLKYLTDVYLYKDSPMNVIRFQVRTKTIETDRRGNETMDEKYDLEEFFVPVPKGYQAETEKVMNFYQDMMDKNADAVAAMMPYGLGLFGK